MLPTRLMMKLEMEPQLLPFWLVPSMRKDSRKLRLALIQLTLKKELIALLSLYLKSFITDQLKFVVARLFQMLQPFQLMEIVKLEICWLICTKKLAFMVPSLSKREKLFIMKSNSLMDSSLTEDISLLTLLLTKRNKKYNSKTAIFCLSRRSSVTFAIFYLSSNSPIKNKSPSSSLLRISRANFSLDSSSTDLKIT